MNMKLITVDPDICNGQPEIRDTRITVQTVLEFLGAGDSIDDILEEYPSLTREMCLNACGFRRSFSSIILLFQEVA